MPPFVAEPCALAQRAIPSADYAAAAEAAESAARSAALAVLDPEAGEVQWLEFELAVAAYGLAGGLVDLDAAQARLGPDGARRLVARATAICARRGVGLLVETRRPPAACDARPLAPPACIG